MTYIHWADSTGRKWLSTPDRGVHICEETEIDEEAFRVVVNWDSNTVTMWPHFLGKHKKRIELDLDDYTEYQGDFDAWLTEQAIANRVHYDSWLEMVFDSL